MSEDKRPIGSWDWNGNGKYDFFDKVTDQYVYDKVTNHKSEEKPKPKPPKKHVEAPPKKSSKYDPPLKDKIDQFFEDLLLLAILFVIFVVVVGVVLGIPYAYIRGKYYYKPYHTRIYYSNYYKYK